MITKIRTLLFILFILIICRSSVYRKLINYSPVGERPETQITNQKLIDQIELKAHDREINLDQIIDIANTITIQELSFTTSNLSTSPNEIMETKHSNCVGYSGMFNAIANYLIRKNSLNQEIKATHQIGKLTLLGINMHQFFKSSFFEDHDFNTIENLKTGKIIAIDPSVSDYLWISSVSSSFTSKSKK